MPTEPPGSLQAPTPRFVNVAVIVAAIFLAKFIAYAWLVTPLWDVPDESGHFSYIQDIVAGEWPVLGEARMGEDVTHSWRGPDATQGMNWIAQHPPLFYVTSAPFLSAARAGQLSFESQVRTTRIPAAIFGALTVFGLALFLARATGRDELGLAGAIFLAATPMFTHLSTGVSHDTLVACTSTWAAYWCLRGLESDNFRHFLACGAFVALATLTKLTALAMAVPLFFALAWWLWRRRGSAGWRQWLGRSGALWLVMFVPMCLWIARNLLTIEQVFPSSSIIYDRELVPIGFVEFMRQFPFWQHTLLNFIALIGWNGSPSGELVWIRADGWTGRYFLGLFAAASIAVLLRPLFHRLGSLQRWGAAVLVTTALAHAYSQWPLMQLAAATCVLLGAAISFTLVTNAGRFFQGDLRGWLLATAAFCTLFFALTYYQHLWSGFTGGMRATHGRYLYPVAPFMLLVLIWPFRGGTASRLVLYGAIAAMVFSDGFYLHRVFNLYGQFQGP